MVNTSYLLEFLCVEISKFNPLAKGKVNCNEDVFVNLFV